jgi:heparan-alpha-glucosaminide N-acetyltransferase
MFFPPMDIPPVESKALATAAPMRLGSIDAYRGLVMFLLLAERLNISAVARKVPELPVWHFLATQQEHVEWTGCVLHDMIQPSFSFLVGVALPFSIGNRRARGQSAEAVTGHAFLRAFILVLLGIFLRSSGHPQANPQTNFTFEDTLTQIGLGYGFLYLLALRSVRVQWVALGVILVGYWLAFALWPLPGPAFDWAHAGVTPDFAGNAAGLAAHWNKNTNLAWAFDTWFLNLFPRNQPFLYNQGGYATLSFIPTLGTMILGLIAGEILRSERPAWARVRWFVIAGFAGLALGWLLGVVGICPVVKRIWTPSWVLFSGGWCFLGLAAFYAVIDVRGWRRWAFPLVVIGMNSIAAYVADHLFPGFLRDSLQIHLGTRAFEVFGPVYSPFVLGVGVVILLWLILYWMWRKKIFLRI